MAKKESVDKVKDTKLEKNKVKIPKVKVSKAKDTKVKGSTGTITDVITDVDEVVEVKNEDSVNDNANCDGEKIIDREVEVRDFERQLIEFKAGDTFFGISVSDVKEIIPYKETIKIPCTNDYIKGMISLRGSIVTVFDLREKLGMSSPESYQGSNILVMTISGVSVGIIVDSVYNVLRVKNSEIGHFSGASSESTEFDKSHVIGVIKLKEKILLLIDLFSLVEEDITVLNKSTFDENKKTILIADDSAMLRSTTRDYTADKFNIVEAKDGSSALEAYNEYMPDLVVLDIKMSPKDGIYALKKIMSQNVDAKIIMVTSVYDEEVQAECLKIGAKAYMKKPLDPVSFMEQVNSLI